MAESYSVEAVLSARDAGFSSSMEKAKSSVSSLGKIAGGLKFGALMAAGGKAFSVITDGAKGLVSELNASQATWKTFESNMQNFGKSSKTIKKVKGDLQDFATKSIYSASDMAGTYSQLAAVGTKNTTDLVKAFGGLAAAAENPQQAMKTLSQQATQMAAKPTVQWMDFKLMLEQTPAGIAEVAKAMGMSTQELVKNVQEGKVKTEDFFNAIRKAGGEGTKLNEMATQYKTMGQAIDGVKESLTTKLQPAFNVVSEYGIKAVNKLEGVMSKIDGDKIAKVLSAGLSKASSVASKVFAKIAPVAASAGKTLYNFGKAVFDVGRSIATNKTFVDGLKTGMTTLGTAVSKVSGFLSKHSETIAKVAPVLLGLVAGYTGLNKVTSLFGNGGAKTASLGFTGITKAFQQLPPANLLSLAGAVGVFVAALGALSAMREMIIPFLEGLVGVFGQFMGVIRQNTDVILELVNGALQGLANAFVTMAPAMQPIAEAFASLSPLITAIGDAVAEVLPKLSPVIESLGTAIGSVVESVGKAVSGITEAFTPIVEIIAEAIVQIVEAIAPYTPEITKMVEATSQAVQSVADAFSTLVENLSGIFDSIGGVIQTFADGAVNVINAFADGASQVLTTFGDTVSTILTNAGNFFTTFAEAVSTVLTTLSTSVETVLSAISTSFETFGTTVETILNGVSGVVDSIGGAIKGVLDGVAGIFESMGTAALNAGKGVKALASGMKTLVGLSLADLAATLTTVAVGMGKMSKNSSGIGKAGSGIKKIASSAKSAGTGLNSLSSAATKASSALTRVATVAAASSGKMRTAGKNAGTGFATGLSSGMAKATSAATKSVNAVIKAMTSAAKNAKTSGKAMGQGFATGLQSTTSKATSVAAKMTQSVANKIKSGRSAAQSAGKYVGQGVAAGLRSALGSVTSAANAIINQVNRAMKAKAKIHSPSKLTNKEVGVPLGQGIIVGLKSQTDGIKNAAQSYVKSGITAMQKAARSSEGQYSATWESVLEKTQNGLTAKQDAILASAKTYTEKLANQYYDSSAMSKQVTANESLIEKLGKDNEAIQEAAEARIEARQAAVESEIEAIQTAAEARADAIQSASETTLAELEKKASGKLTKKQAKAVKKAIANEKASANAQVKAVDSGTDAQAKAMQDALKSEIAFIRQSTDAQVKANKQKVKDLTAENKKMNKAISANASSASKLQASLYAQYEKQIKDETSKAVSAIKSQMEAISSKYQAMYDVIAGQRSEFLGKMQDYGSLYEADQYGYVAFKDWNKSVKEMTILQANLKKLQRAGVSQGFLSEVTSMSTAEALTYTNALLKKGTKFIKSQSNGYEKMMKTATQVSTNVYKPYVDSVDKAYNHDLVNSLATLQKKLEQIGKNAASALARGLKSVSTAKAAKQVAGNVMNAFKTQLGIHSPSKVFTGYGEMTGLGYINGLRGITRKVRTVTADMIHIPSARTPSMAYAGGLSDNYSYGSSRYEITVVSEIDGKEFARATVDPMSEELNRKNRNNNRNRGQR